VEARIIKSNDDAKITWLDGWMSGEITIIWDQTLGKFIVDTEMLGIDSMIKIIQSIK
jgi:hypothetical protein